MKIPRWPPRVHLRWGLTQTLVLGMGLVIGLLMAVTSLLEIRDERADAIQNLETEGIHLIQALDELLADALYASDVDRLRDLADVLVARPNVQYVRVFRPSGRLVVDTEQTEYPTGHISSEHVPTRPGALVKVRRINEDILEISGSTQVGSEALGGLQIGFNTKSIEAELGPAIRREVWQFLALLLAGVFVSYLLGQYVVRPIRRLAGAMREASGGELEIAGLDSRSDEIGELALAFDNMIRRIETYRNELEERAEALASSNERLRVEIDERRRAEDEIRRSRKRVVDSVEHLRREIGHSLHSSVQSKLIVMLHRINEAARVTSSAEGTEIIGDVQRNLRQLIDGELHSISQRLYPSILRRGLVPAVQSLGDQFESVLTMKMELDENLVGREKANSKLIPDPVRLAA